MKHKFFCNLSKKIPLGWVVQSWVKKAQGTWKIWIPKILKPKFIFSQFLSAIWWLDTLKRIEKIYARKEEETWFKM